MGGHGIANRTMEHSWPQTNSTDCTPSSCHRSLLLSPPPPSPFDEVLYSLPNPHSLIDNRARETRPRIEFWIDRQAGRQHMGAHRASTKQNGIFRHNCGQIPISGDSLVVWSGPVVLPYDTLSAAVDKTLSQRNCGNVKSGLDRVGACWGCPKCIFSKLFSIFIVLRCFIVVQSWRKWQ